MKTVPFLSLRMMILCNVKDRVKNITKQVKMEPHTLLKSLLSSEKLKPILVPKLSNAAIFSFYKHFFFSLLIAYFLVLDDRFIVNGIGSVTV